MKELVKIEAWEKIKIGNHGYKLKDLSLLTKKELKKINSYGYITDFHYHYELLKREYGNK